MGNDDLIQAFPFFLLEVDGAFSACDVNGNGRISTGELKDAFHSVGYDPTRAEVRAMIQAFDLDSE